MLAFRRIHLARAAQTGEINPFSSRVFVSRDSVFFGALAHDRHFQPRRCRRRCPTFRRHSIAISMRYSR
jgi:hypothetical protein